MILAVYWLCVAVLLSCNVLVQSEITTLYPTDPQDWSLFPYGAGDVEIQDGNDISTEVDGLSHNIIFQGISYDSVSVYTDGYLTLTLINDMWTNAVIAPYNADIDFSQYTLGFNSYRQDSTPETLARATDAVMAIRQYVQELPDFQATWTLIVTWHDAVPFMSDSTEKNTFQIVLVCDDAHTFAIFNYGNQMDWGNLGSGIRFYGADRDNGYVLPGSYTDAINDIVRNKRMIFRVDPHTFDLCSIVI